MIGKYLLIILLVFKTVGAAEFYGGSMSFETFTDGNDKKVLYNS